MTEAIAELKKILTERLITEKKIVDDDVARNSATEVTKTTERDLWFTLAFVFTWVLH